MVKARGMKIKAAAVLTVAAISFSAIQTSANQTPYLNHCKEVHCQQEIELFTRISLYPHSKRDSNQAPNPSDTHLSPIKDTSTESSKPSKDAKVDKPVKPKDMPSKSVEVHNATDQPAKSADSSHIKETEVHKGTDSPAKSTEKSVKPTEVPNKSDEAHKTTNPPIETHKFTKPSTESHRPIETSDKSTEVHHTADSPNKPTETHKTAKVTTTPVKVHPTVVSKSINSPKADDTHTNNNNNQPKTELHSDVGKPTTTSEATRVSNTHGVSNTNKNLPEASSIDSSSSTSATLPAINSDSSREKSGKNHTGAIVGGVVGGAAGLAALVGLIGYRYLKKRKQFTTVDFGVNNVAMSSSSTTGYNGGSRFNAVTPAIVALPRSDPSMDIERATGAEVATDTLSRQSDSFYRSPSPTEYNSVQRSKYTDSRASSHPSFGSTDAIVSAGVTADQYQYNHYSPERSRNRPNTPPINYGTSNQNLNSEMSPRISKPLPTPRMQTPIPKSIIPDNPDHESTANIEQLPIVYPQRNPEPDRFIASQIPNRQGAKLVTNTDLGRNATIKSTVTSSSTGTGIREDDLEETVIIGFNEDVMGRSRNDPSLEQNSRKELNPSSEQPLFIMTAIEPYMPERPNELLVQPDDELIITEEVSDQWFVGYNRSRNPNVKGYFPRYCVVGSCY